MADPRGVITVLILLFILFSPSSGPEQLPSARNRFQEILNYERHNLDLLNTTKYGDFDPLHGRFFNLTGLERGNEFAWGQLDKVKERAKKMSLYALGGGAEGIIERPDAVFKDPDLKGYVGEEDLGLGTGKRLNTGEIPLYKNVTGILHGDWVRSPLQEEFKSPALNLSAYASEGPFGPLEIQKFGRNLTERATRGWVRVVLEENDKEETLLSKTGSIGKKKDLLRQIRASINIGDEETGDDWENQVYGVHFLETGNIVLSTTSTKFAGIFALPHMTFSGYNYGLAQQLLNRTLGSTIHDQEVGLVHGFNPWSSASEGQGENGNTAPKCELIFYLQQHPVSLPAMALPLIESELRAPTGAFPPPPSDMRFSMLAFSPDCGYVLESKGPPDYVRQGGNHLTGLKVEVQHDRARQHILIFSLVLFGQVLLLIRQMGDSSTPSTRSRISFYTIATLAMGDGYTTMTLCLASLFVQSVWVPLIGCAFLAFISVSFFGMRFLLDIYTVQAPERERAERTRREALAAALPIITAAGADTLPLPVTAAPPIDTGAAAVFIPSDQDITQPSSPPPGTTALPGTLPTTNAPATNNPDNGRVPGFGALYTRFYFLLLATLFLSLNATGWPASIRRFYFTFLAFLYLSLWTPQIHRNILRNCRRALRWDFVLGQSFLRLVPFMYFYGYDKNIVFAEVDGIGLAVLSAWVWIQVLGLGSQEVLGPRWFVPKGFGVDWVPKAYDYHPILHEDEEGGNLPIGAAEAFAASSTESDDTASTTGGKRSAGDGRDKSKRTFDCAICMGDLEVPVFAESGAADVGGLSSGALLLERRRYMVTPCRHVFHSGCLEGWMKYRLQCPVCREELPPV
ncbi:hypothetical protein BDV97DRAFT_302164 [Delphinella strobiligena]|nr:hypothetical protein BDV97DRAFT_302164 [Delphinella strobiligena]